MDVEFNNNNGDAGMETIHRLLETAALAHANGDTELFTQCVVLGAGEEEVSASIQADLRDEVSLPCPVSVL